MMNAAPAIALKPTLPVTSPHHASDDDRRFCCEILPRVSRTFALSIAALPPQLCEAVRVAYLLCRIVDTVEDDETLGAERRRALFDAFDALMLDDTLAATAFERLAHVAALGEGSADYDLCQHAGAVFRCFRACDADRRAAIRPTVLEMSRGMRQYALEADKHGKLRLASLPELERYCHYVAGTVGKLLTALFELQTPSLSPRVLAALRARAISFGLALQLVNIVKDVAADLSRGDCFLPAQLAREHGIALDDILDPDHRPAGLAVVRAVCARAREHLRRAQQYTLLWPAEEGRQVRLFCAVPLALALATLAEVEHGDDTLRPGRTPKVSRQVVMAVFTEAQQAAGDNAQLARLFQRYQSLTATVPA